jgi:hypothetical protein
MPRKTKRSAPKTTPKPDSLANAIDAVASAIAMALIIQTGSKKDRAKAVAWLKTWFVKDKVFTD